MDARRAAPRLRLAQPLPPWVTQRVVVIEPGEEASVVEPWWDDALVLVTRGSVELCGRAGTRRALPEGAVLWVDGLALRAVRNRGDRPAVLVAVRRAPSHRAGGQDPVSPGEDSGSGADSRAAPA